MGVHQFLKTQNVQPIHGVMLMAALGIFIVLVPFIPRLQWRNNDRLGFRHRTRESSISFRKPSYVGSSGLPVWCIRTVALAICELRGKTHVLT
jgi:hypothetical protein